MRKVEITPGAVYGKWTVLGENPVRSKHGEVMQFVRCDCGFETSVQGYHLRSGASKGCSPCVSPFPSYKNIHGSYMSNLLGNAKSRKMEVFITITDLYDIWEHQNGKCALTGWNLTLRQFAKDFDSTASVDRIDSKLTYLPYNIQWVHKDINKMKLNHDEAYFFEMCRAVSANKDQTVKLRGVRPWRKD